MSKLSDFLTERKIDTRRLLVASKRLESLKDEDRAVKLSKKRAKAADASDADKAMAAKERRSGRPLSPATLRAALEGKAPSGPAKTRIVRAVNHLLAQKKAGSEITVRDLF